MDQEDRERSRVMAGLGATESLVVVDHDPAWVDRGSTERDLPGPRSYGRG